ncbi:HNH endonuclease [Haloprofundus salilacus]|uniref:HNH endonuclease n=1 Tax=Haloprofundus salilacus TaxID=2876190 RepID=UPI001CCC1790|nr:HNH endonuclease signature motif containing protein [Haloprofundus salilacus]
MGIVRRDGKWRLDKREAGVYEVTFENQPELKIVTSDYSPRGFMDERTDFSIEVREVDSFSEAEALFEEVAKGSSSRIGGHSLPIGANESETFDGSGEDYSLSDLPPVGALLFGTLVGGILINSSGLAVQSMSFLIGVAFFILPLAVLAFTYREYASNGPKAAITYLFTVEESNKDNSRSEDETPDRTPPAPQALKNELYFERAERKCEWCNESIDSHETHHIRPRSEGGPNEPNNLIILCPNCHDKADRGMISRSKLKRVVSMNSKQ